MNQAQEILDAMRERPPALEPWKNRKHVRIRQQANDMVASGKLKPKACQQRGCIVGPSNTVKHHVAYDRPDNVKWYCEPHHDAAHVSMDKMPVESCSAKCSTCGQTSCRCNADRNTNQSQQIMADLGEEEVDRRVVKRRRRKRKGVDRRVAIEFAKDQEKAQQRSRKKSQRDFRLALGLPLK